MISTRISNIYGDQNMTGLTAPIVTNQPAANPLAKHFRQPILYLKLPSEGKWYPQGTLDLPVTGEVPVYAMTARDELILKTPDALLNGASTVQVIQSCIPAIKNAWQMPLVDLDSALIAIRIATYSNQMDFTTVCPKCKTEIDQGLDLGVMLAKIQLANWTTPIQVDNLEITLKPLSYEQYNKNNRSNFEEQRLMRVVQNTELSDEEKATQYNVLFQRLVDSGINQVGKSIAFIRLEDGSTVDNLKFIQEFLDNCDKSVWDSLKTHLDEIRKNTNYTNVNITCTNEECAHVFVTPFIFEQTNFFA